MYTRFKEKTGWLRVAMLLVSMVTAPTAIAGDPKDPEDSSPTHSAANQSVGIEELPPPQPLSEVAQKDTEVGSKPVAAGATDSPTAVQLPPRGEKRLRTAQREAPTTGIRPNPGGLGGLWPLFAVTALIGVLYIIVRRYRGGALVNASGAMRVLGRLSLSPKHQLALVQVGHRVLVVGVSAGDMRTLHVVEDADEAAMLAARSGNSRGDGVFAEWLGREGQRFDEVEADGETTAPPKRGPSGVSELLKKVRTMQTQ